MSIGDGIILGIVQGLTEFLPVSSTGHLILAREFLGLETAFGLAVDAALHLATAFAVMVYFRNDLLRMLYALSTARGGGAMDPATKTLWLALILGTIPAVLIGVPLEKTIESAFRNTELVAYALIAGSLLFIAAEKFGSHTAPLTAKKGLMLGFFQALALIPGISRSGSVIAGGLLLGLRREDAARFAFLLSFPIILGAGAKKLVELGASGFLNDFGMPLLVAALAAFLAGVAAIHFLITFLRTHTLYPFVVYRLVLAAIILMWMA